MQNETNAWRIYALQAFMHNADIWKMYSQRKLLLFYVNALRMWNVHIA